MDSSQILTITVFVIVITIVGTIALAIVGYLAFRLRDRKHPSGPELDQSTGTPHFFERIRLPDSGDTPGGPADAAAGTAQAETAQAETAQAETAQAETAQAEDSSVDDSPRD